MEIPKMKKEVRNVRVEISEMIMIEHILTQSCDNSFRKQKGCHTPLPDFSYFSLRKQKEQNRYLLILDRRWRTFICTSSNSTEIMKSDDSRLLDRTKCVSFRVFFPCSIIWQTMTREYHSIFLLINCCLKGFPLLEPLTLHPTFCFCRFRECYFAHIELINRSLSTTSWFFRSRYVRLLSVTLFNDSFVSVNPWFQFHLILPSISWKPWGELSLPLFLCFQEEEQEFLSFS
jgi:hypothetical protein